MGKKCCRNCKYAHQTFGIGLKEEFQIWECKSLVLIEDSPTNMYGSDRTYLHTENRFFFKVIPHLRVGANIVITSGEGNGDFYVKPMAVLRVDL